MAPPFRIVTADEVIEMLKGRTYKWAQVHHTWKPDHSDFNGHNHLRLQQGMYNYHVNVRGWQDIGQHLTLFPDGKFVTGRPFDMIPAGIKGWNTGSFMIEHLGNFDVGHDKLEGKQLEASLKVYNYLVNHCGSEILFHREHAAKSCPGTGIDESEFVEAVKHFSGGHVDYEPVTKAAHISTLIQKGDSGPAVLQLQKDLIKAGEKLPRYGADGQFGEETEQALKAFQARHGLVVDGIFGPKSLRKLKQVLANQPSGQAIVPYPGHIFTIGSRGHDVERIQRAVGAKVDGIYGEHTAAAVRAYQERHGLAVDGIVGINTWNTLF